MRAKVTNIVRRLAVCAVVATIIGTVSADWVTTTVPAGEIPNAVAVNPITNKIYGANDVTLLSSRVYFVRHPSSVTKVVVTTQSTKVVIAR